MTEPTDEHGPPAARASQASESDPMVTATNRRMVLAQTRQSVTHKFMVGGCEGYLTVGLFDDGRPGEIFIKIAKEGYTLSGLVQGFCRAFSLALQYGLPLQDAVDRFRDMNFEPSGRTGHPDIPEASSILDYVARYLELEFIEKPGGVERSGDGVWSN